MDVTDLVRNPGDVMRRIADLERQVRELQAARAAEATSIGTGGIHINSNGSLTVDSGGTGIIILHDTGQEMLHAGRIDDPVFGPVEMLIMRNRDGTRKARFQSNVFGFEDWVLFDNGETVIAGSDGTAGEGLLRPHVPNIFESLSTPADSTGGGVFVTLLRSVWHKQHHNGLFWVRSVVTSTTGELQFVVGSGPNSGTVIGGPVTISGTTHTSYGPYAVPGAVNTEFFVDVQARVASGAGTVSVRAMGYGVGSS